ncbi:hypothetical protein ACFFTN_22340 [Aminobacter aganoensis]|uniref:Glycosyltransferase 2-like domain-containing protein n=1 Tax=Aminobacter aganoensis TaxID=83264 RepID=A0A7X0F7A8_9HYPH|nr:MULTISPECIES: hypothetical protein [Aminobacter]KQU75264.1 hypothetical protein ASC75_18065 [Aminobacter sp. DSM 101952]MBB6354377.1 hypothetical protein [Aminobacter aganoensis]
MIDLTMTATRRPDLVAITLASFQQKLFDRFPVRTFFLNIDPIWGSEEDGNRVEEIARSYFTTVVRRPAEASYGGAVKWLWQQPETEWFLHLEDDWILSHKISLKRLRKQMAEPNVGQIAICNWSRLGRRKITPRIGVGPLFASRALASIASEHMNPDLDPDKQFMNGTNTALADASSSYRAVYFGGPFTRRTAIDIGRDWRDKRGIEKQIIDGVAVWTPEAS